MQSYNSKIKIDIKTRAYRYALRIRQFVDNLQKEMSDCVPDLVESSLFTAARSIIF
jgi:hypothetical protein